MEKGTCKQGVFVRSKITGKEGLVTGKMIWMFGCEKIIVKPKDNNSMFSDLQQRLIIAEEYLELTGEESEFECEFSVPDTEKWFGKKCRDRITGIEGICAVCVTSLFSSDQYGLEWKNKKGKCDHEWFDEGRLEIIGDGINPDAVSTSHPGGFDMPLPRITLPEYAF